MTICKRLVFFAVNAVVVDAKISPKRLASVISQFELITRPGAGVTLLLDQFREVLVYRSKCFLSASVSASSKICRPSSANSLGNINGGMTRVELRPQPNVNSPRSKQL